MDTDSVYDLLRRNGFTLHALSKTTRVYMTAHATVAAYALKVDGRTLKFIAEKLNDTGLRPAKATGITSGILCRNYCAAPSIMTARRPKGCAKYWKAQGLSLNNCAQTGENGHTPGAGAVVRADGQESAHRMGWLSVGTASRRLVRRGVALRLGVALLLALRGFRAGFSVAEAVSALGFLPLRLRDGLTSVIAHEVIFHFRVLALFHFSFFCRFACRCKFSLGHGFPYPVLFCRVFGLIGVSSIKAIYSLL